MMYVFYIYKIYTGPGSCNSAGNFINLTFEQSPIEQQQLMFSTTTLGRFGQILVCPISTRCHTIRYSDATMGAMASQITSLTIVYSIVYSDADQRKHQSATSLAFVRGIHRWPVNSPQKWPVTRKMFPFDDVIMYINPIVVQSTYKAMTADIFHNYTRLSIRIRF